MRKTQPYVPMSYTADCLMAWLTHCWAAGKSPRRILNIRTFYDTELNSVTEHLWGWYETKEAGCDANLKGWPQSPVLVWCDAAGGGHKKRPRYHIYHALLMIAGNSHPAHVARSCSRSWSAFYPAPDVCGARVTCNVSRAMRVSRGAYIKTQDIFWHIRSCIISCW